MNNIGEDDIISLTSNIDIMLLNANHGLFELVMLDDRYTSIMDDITRIRGEFNILRESQLIPDRDTTIPPPPFNDDGTDLSLDRAHINFMG